MKAKSQSFIERPVKDASEIAAVLKGYGFRATVETKTQVQRGAVWRETVWSLLVDYANAADLNNARAKNRIVKLMSALDFDLYRANDSVERGIRDDPEIARVNIQNAVVAQPQVRELLAWIADPGGDPQLDCRALAILTEHVRHTTAHLDLIGGRDVLRQFEFRDFIDPIAQFIYDHFRQSGQRTARLSEPSPLRICDVGECRQFFLPDHKYSRCPKHRKLARVWRKREDNSWYNYIVRNLDTKRTTMGQLNQRIGWAIKKSHRPRVVLLRWVRKNRKVGRKGKPQLYFDRFREHFGGHDAGKGKSIKEGTAAVSRILGIPKSHRSST